MEKGKGRKEAMNEDKGEGWAKGGKGRRKGGRAEEREEYIEGRMNERKEGSMQRRKEWRRKVIWKSGSKRQKRKW